MHRDTPSEAQDLAPQTHSRALPGNAQPLKLISTGALIHKPSPLSITELNPCVSVSPIGSSEADVFVQKASASATNAFIKRPADTQRCYRIAYPVCSPFCVALRTTSVPFRQCSQNGSDQPVFIENHPTNETGLRRLP